MRILQVAFLLLFNYLDSLPKLYVYNWLKNGKYDVCLIQETFCTPSSSGQFQKGWPGDMFHSFTNSSHSRGVCIMLNKCVDYNVLSMRADTKGRLVLLTLEVNGKELTIINVYAPNIASERIFFFKQVSKFIDQHAVNKDGLIVMLEETLIVSYQVETEAHV